MFDRFKGISFFHMPFHFAANLSEDFGEERRSGQHSDLATLAE
jgi:hypothetical protein